MSKNNQQCKIVFEWEIDGNILKDVENGKCFNSKTVGLPGYPFKGIQYYFSLYPNGKEEDQKGAIWIYFNVGMRYAKDIQVNLNFVNPKSKKVSRTFVFHDSASLGIEYVCDQEMMGQNFFTTGKFHFRCSIAFTVLKNDKIMGNVPNLLSQKLLNDDEKDLKIIIGDRELMAHKCVLSSFSPMIKAFKNAGDNEFESIIEIPDFDYTTIKAAIDFCYGYKNLNNVSINCLFSLLKFASKYTIEDLKKELEYILMPKINPKNVCEISNLSIDCNAKWLQKQCHDRLKSWITGNKFIPNIDTLDTKIMKEVLKHLGIRDGLCRVENVRKNKRVDPEVDLFLYVILLIIFFGWTFSQYMLWTKQRNF